MYPFTSSIMNMSAAIRNICLWCLGFGLAALPGSGQTRDLMRLGNGIYVHLVSPDSNAVANAGVILLEESVLVFDTHFSPEAGRMLRRKIGRITNLPVRYIVVSHFHPDHTHGNQSFPGVWQILGSTNTRRDMLEKDLPSLNRSRELAERDIDLKQKTIDRMDDAVLRAKLTSEVIGRRRFLENLAALEIRAPAMSLDDTITIVDRNREVQLIDLGSGHTDGDIILLLPRERIAFLGDLFFNRGLPNTEDANLQEWMKTLEKILELPADTFVPGHGPIGTKYEVERFLNYFHTLRALIEPAVLRDDTLEMVLEEVEIPGRFSYYDFQNFFPLNVQKMYAELKALKLAADAQEEEAGKKKPSPPESQQ
jgi:glyoxylase-like metal-dependent hydrolase (beta-lactamase superfamily II)